MKTECSSPCGPHCQMPCLTLVFKTYVDDAGEDRRERRRKDRDDDDPRIDHLFHGFDNMIANADEYDSGYLKAMRLEFGQLVASLVR